MTDILSEIAQATGGKIQEVAALPRWFGRRDPTNAIVMFKNIASVLQVNVIEND